jgi:hypothetical protein
MAHLLREERRLLHPEPTQYVCLYYPVSLSPALQAPGAFLLSVSCLSEHLNRVVSPQDAI